MKKLAFLIGILTCFCSFNVYSNCMEVSPVCSPLLLNKIQQAKAGDYLVIKRNSTLTLMHIFDLKNDSVSIEELIIPEYKFSPLKLSWKEWLKNGAPRHSSWIGYEINIRNGMITELYSFNKQAHLQIHQMDSFISTLLKLPFAIVPEENRKKIGPPPSHGKIDTRNLWQPSLIFEGEAIHEVAFDAYQAYWPQDNSELSGKQIEIFLPSTDGPFPSYLPYWLHIDDYLINARFRIIDSGTDLESPQKAIPHRPPVINSYFYTEAGDFQILLELPAFYQEFSLLAVKENTSLNTALSLPFQTAPIEGNLNVQATILKETLHQHLSIGNAYFFYISPKNNPYLMVQTEKPIVIK